MNVLHLMYTGATGGIEVLMKNYSYHSKLNNVFYFACKGGVIADEMKANGIPVIIGDKEKKGNHAILKDILLKCEYDEYDAVIVHHSAPLLRFVSYIIKRRYPQIIVINYAHSDAKRMGIEANPMKQLMSYVAHDLAMNKSDRIIAISKFVRDSLISKFRIDPKKIIVLYNGIPIREYVVKKHGLHRPIRFIYVGRLTEEKGVHVIIKALSEIPNELQYCFTIVGDGPFRPKLEQMVMNYKLTNKISFLGTRQDVPDLLQKADVFIHTPVCEEGFGITIVEAMASGHVCVCSESGAIPEIIHDHQNGLLIPKNDPTQLSRVLTGLIYEYPSSRLTKMEESAIVAAAQFDIVKYTTEFDAVITNGK